MWRLHEGICILDGIPYQPRNGMLLSVFDLLADARSQITTVNGYIEALRDFWLAQADLDMALIGKPSPSNVPASMGAVAANEGGGH